jgi:hypothetical protein
VAWLLKRTSIDLLTGLDDDADDGDAVVERARDGGERGAEFV